MLKLQDLAIDLESTKKTVEGFIKSEVKTARAKGAVVGMSGGLDSSTVAKLCVSALGPSNVLGLILPFIEGDIDSADAVNYARALGIAYEVINIKHTLSALQQSCKHFKRRKRLPKANLIPRIRMAVLYYHANLLNYLVIGTGNKSEISAGYFTKYGDGAVDILPIGDLYKTQVRMLAEYIGIPGHILKKVPSPGLWKGQTDEGELGITYPELDLILFAVEKGLSKEEIHRETQLSKHKIELVMRRFTESKHKRKMPPVAKIS
ncbi:MAG: NAD+ synthase [Methanocellales archaeon]